MTACAGRDAGSSPRKSQGGRRTTITRDEVLGGYYASCSFPRPRSLVHIDPGQASVRFLEGQRRCMACGTAKEKEGVGFISALAGRITFELSRAQMRSDE